MKATSIIFVLLMVSATFGEQRRAVTSTNTIHLTSFTLRDQHDQERKLVLPQPRAFVLTVADRKGSQQIEPWVRPLKERYGEPLLVQGIADMSAVPKLLRTTIRKQFKKDFSPSVMLDWEGQMTTKLNPTPDAVNLYIVATNGSVIFSTNGPANEKKLEQIYKTLDEHIPRVALTNSPLGKSPVER